MASQKHELVAGSSPVSEKRPHILLSHGDKRIDNYFWLRESKDPKVIAYLEAENAYTVKMMQHTEVLQNILYKQMLDCIPETDLSVPYRNGSFYYYWRREVGKNYEIYCRKRGSLGAVEEVLLDQNKLAEGYKYFSLGVCEVSPDCQVLAYSIDISGGEQYTLFFLDLATGERYPESCVGVSSFAWANDNREAFYTQIDATNRPSKLFRHTLGSDSATDALVHHEVDETYDFLVVSKTRTQAYLLLYLGSPQTSEIHYLDANHPTGIFQVIHPRSVGMLYNVEHHSDYFYILTNDEAVNFKLMKTPVASPSKDNWLPVIPHQEGIVIQSCYAFADYLAILEREAGSARLRLHQISTNDEYYVPFPDPTYVLDLTGNPEFNTATLRIRYNSPITPESIFDYNMATREMTLKKQTCVLGYDKTQYTTERVMANTSDGVRVPISLIYKQGVARNGHNPLLLCGYASYGDYEDIYFSSSSLPLLDRGVVIACAHVRGAGTMGTQWYENGKLLNKKNTFTDFIACAEHLVASGWTSGDRLIISSASAGGLLIGAVLNMRPDLFHAAVAHRPLVDLLTSMLDTMAPFSEVGFEEWGNPNEKVYYDYIKSYCPYDNVSAQDYPSILITAGLHDPMVSYWEPVKWTAKLRDLKTNDNLLLLKVDMDSGHTGASGLHDRLKELAFEYAFLLDQWELT